MTSSSSSLSIVLPGRFGEATRCRFGFFDRCHGAVLKAKVVESSGVKIFGDAARAALSRCTYLPLKVAGKAVGGWAHVRYKWILE